MRRRRVPVPVSAAAHNRVLKLAAHRADRLESRLADAIEPVLRRAGEEAARAFRARVTDHLTAAGDGVTSSSTMVAVAPRADERERIAADGGLDAETLHVTLAYLGELDGDLTDVVDALKPVAATYAPLVGEVAGAGFFGDPADEGPTVLLPDVPGLVELRVAASEALARAGIDYGRDHGFLAHVTIDYRDGEPRPPVEYEPWGEPLHFDSLLVVRGDVVVAELPLVGVPPLTAAGEPPGWSAPAPDELLDLDALVAAIRAKTDPVREALLRETMTPALEQAGLAFDVTNPYVGNALAKSGAKVTNIAETTQANVMRTIRAAHDNGLSIPQTADVIRAGMASASGARATMIARTELAQVVNGGSLAATMIVASATGASYTKKWLIAPGAPSPRHELYEGLDGQEAGLEDYFDVGGSQLQYPGDADGDPAETINCFPAETLVEMPALRAATRRWYEGDLVRVRFASDNALAATPNHPVLRADGIWVPLREVEEGDHLVGALLAWDAAGAPDPDRPPAAISEVYRLAEVAGDPERIRVAPPDFHGDGADGEIDVVSLDGELLLDSEAATDEEVAELGLALASGARARASRGDGAAAIFDGWGEHFHVSAAYGVSPDSQEAAILVAHPLHPQPVRLGSAADGQAELAEATHDRRAADSDVPADREDAIAALVSLAEVVQVKVEPFHGYVYNLDTGSGWYTAGTIVCRNCRCTMSYDTPGGVMTSDSDEAPDLEEGGEGGEGGGALGAAPMTAALSADEVQAIADYTGYGTMGQGSSSINRYLRGSYAPRGPEAEKIRSRVSLIDSAIDKAAPTTSPETVYRALAQPVDVEVGKTLEDPAFVSTSASRNLPESWASPYGDVWQIDLPAGTKALDLSTLPQGTSAAGEREILLPRGSKIVVDSYEQRGPDRFPNGFSRPGRFVRAHLVVEGEEVATATVELAPADVLTIKGGTRGAHVARRKAIEDAIEQLSSVVQLPGRATLGEDGVRVTMRASQGRLGHMKYMGGRVVEINVASDAHSAVTFAHEFGHMLDLTYVGEEGRFGTLAFQQGRVSGELADAFQALDNAWQNSAAIQQLNSLGADRLARYMCSRREMWARSFAQWSAGRADAGSLLRQQLEQDIAENAQKVAQLDRVPGMHLYLDTWQPDDFAPIAAAIERVLSVAGLLRGAPTA